MSAPAPMQIIPTGFPHARLTLGHLIRSEWIKLRTLSSPWISALIVIVLSLGISMIAAFSVSTIGYGYVDRIPADMIASIVGQPAVFTMLLAMILGAILITGEYSTGMIRTTITAAPDRLSSLVAKAVVVFLFSAVLGLATTVVSGLGVLLVLLMRGISADFSVGFAAFAPYVFVPLLMGAVALLGLGIGYLLRSGAGAIAIVVGVTFVLPIVLTSVGIIPGMDWMYELSYYVPLHAATDLIGAGEDALRGGITLTVWALAAMFFGGLALKTRDV